MRHWEHQGMAKWFESWPNMYEMKPRMIFIKHIHKTQWWVDTNNDELTPSCSLKESSLTPLRRFASQGHHTSVLAQAHSDASRTVQYEGAILGWPYLTLVGWGLTNLSNFVARPLPSRWYHCVFIDKNSPKATRLIGWTSVEGWHQLWNFPDRLDVYNQQTSQASLPFHGRFKFKD